MSDGPLQSLINGEQTQHISILDRGLQYGDGCFETVRVIDRKPVLWTEHLERLRHACNVLEIRIDLSLIEREAFLIIQQSDVASAVLKIIVTRGQGGRGYTPPDQAQCSRILQLFAYEQPETERGARAIICGHRLSSNMHLAGIKHLNRLDQVLASSQIPDGFDEGLCLDQSNNLVEGCRSNLCLAVEGRLLTPRLTLCGVEGVMLEHLNKGFERAGVALEKAVVSLESLLRAEELFLCNSVFGIWPVTAVQDESGADIWVADCGPFSKIAQELAHEIFCHAQHP